MTSYEELIEDSFGASYEKANMASSYFGIEKIDVILLMILSEFQELNRLLYNELEARK